jgi:periplasmic divalent cation tolerance protein
MTACIVYVVAADEAEADRIGRAAVEERLAASVNMLPRVRSYYWWRGKLETASEAALILKTRADLAERLAARVRALHSYECPCVMVLPVTGGDPAYLDWIEAETTGG